MYRKEMIFVSFCVEPEVKRELKEIVTFEGINVSVFLRKLVKKAIDQYKQNGVLN